MGIQQFISTLSVKTKTQGEFNIIPLSEPILVYTASKTDPSSPVPMDTIYWKRPYQSSEFQSVANATGITKDFFWLYSTDHGEGKIRVGQSNSLFATDFEDLGLVTENYQAETPYLVNAPLAPDNEKVHLFFHTTTNEPGNNSKQQTRLFTTDNKSLINMRSSWTDRGRPLPIGIIPSEQHTGYFVPTKIREDYWTGRHLVRGLVPDLGALGGISTSVDGRTWERLKFSEPSPYWTGQGLTTPGGEKNMMKLNGEYFGVAMTRLIDTGSVAKNFKLTVCQYDENGEFLKFIKYINEDISTNYVLTFQDSPATFYIYFSTRQKDFWVQKWKLTNGQMDTRI